MILTEMKSKISYSRKYSGGNRRRLYRNHFLCRFRQVFVLASHRAQPLAYFCQLFLNCNHELTARKASSFVMEGPNVQDHFHPQAPNCTKATTM